MKTLMFTLMLLVFGASYSQSPATTAYRQYASNTEMWDGTVWLEVDSSRYFKTADNDTLIYSYSWNNVDMQWDVYFRSFYSYDANGYRTGYRTELWDGTLFTNYQKEDIVFDANGNQLSFIRYDWDGANWLPTMRFTSLYDAQNNITSRTREEYVSGSWVNDDRTLYTYSGGVLSTFETQEWVSGAWTKIRRGVYTYDANGNLPVVLSQTWDGSNYINDYQYVRTYDSNGNVLTETYVDWVSGAWDTINREVKTYNSANNVTMMLRQVNNSGVWTNTRREISTYNNPALIDTFLSQEYTGGLWINAILRTYAYDSNDNYVYGEYFNWVSGTWSNGYRYFNYYETYDVVGIEQPLMELGARAYPNPFAEKVNFKLPIDVKGTVEIQVFDMQGKNVLIENQFVAVGEQLISIPTGNLPAGTYVFVLTLDGKQSRGLIAK